MPRLHYKEQTITLEAGQTVLDSLLAHGYEVANSCRAGACQSCLMQASAGDIPAAAQAGLKPTLAVQGYFLACQCTPQDDLTIRPADEIGLRQGATVTGLRRLSDQVMEISLSPDAPYEYRAGQYATLWRDARLGRSYSLASVPALDDALHFHVRHIPGGLFSGWVFDGLEVGDRLDIQAAAGDCIYLPEAADEPHDLLLVGTSTGLAPLYGILRDALSQGHKGDIHLYHGTLQPAGLYLRKELAELAAQHANVHYHPAALEGDADTPQGAVDAMALQQLPALHNPSAYLCGADDFVQALRKQLFLRGMNMSRIHLDAFLPATGQAAETA